jgi:hypothetical protein
MEPADTHTDVPEHVTGEAEAGSQEEHATEPIVGPPASNGLNAALGTSQ